MGSYNKRNNQPNVDKSVDIDKTKDSYNDNSVDSTIGITKTFTATDSFNDNSVEDRSVDVGDVLSGNTQLNDSQNDNSSTTNTTNTTQNSGNETVTVGVDVDVPITNSFNTNDSTNDSYNQTDNSTSDYDFAANGSFNKSVDKSVADSFNFSDDDLIDVDGFGSSLHNIAALGGNGNAIAIDQTWSINDGDSLNATIYGPVCADVGVGGYNDGGGAGYADSNLGSGGEHSTAGGNASTSADAVTSLSAFNQDISMGANIQYANVNLNVIGSSSGSSISDDDA